MKLIRAHNHTLPTGVLGLAITSDGSRAVCACADGIIYDFFTADGRMEPFEGGHAPSYASGAVLLPDGATLITSGYDGRLVWHDIATRQQKMALQAHDFWSWQLAVSRDGSRIASVTGQYLAAGWKYEPDVEVEPSVRVLDARTGKDVATFSHVPPVQSCAFSPDGRYLAAGNLLGEVRVWDLEAGSGSAPVSKWGSPDFTSWGTTKSHHYSGGIFALAFSPDGSTLLGCGMGPTGDPMAGNGKTVWQRWDWRKGERRDQIKDGQHGTGLMEALDWHPDGKHFVMSGRLAQGTWNTGIFGEDGGLVTSIDCQMRTTQARFTADGGHLILAGCNGQKPRQNGIWPAWGRVQVYHVET